MTASGDDWIGVPEIAKMIGRSEDAVRDLLEERRIPTAYRLGPGSHWRAQVSGVRQFLEDLASATRPKKRTGK